MFDLEIKFTGLIMYLVHGDPPASPGDPLVGRKVTVVIPECRQHFVDAKHDDGTEGAHHVGYMRMDLASIVGPHASFPAAAAEVAAVPSDPPYEVVHRFTNQVLDFGLPGEEREEGEDGVDTSINVHTRLPEFDRLAPRLEPRPELFDERAADLAVLRTTLTRGSLTGQPKQEWKFSNVLGDPNEAYSGKFAEALTWTRTVPDRNWLTLTLAPLAGGEAQQQVTLFPVAGPTGRPTISLKIANLCCENPLEWAELDARGAIHRDDDFKWLYRLMQPVAERTRGRQPAPRRTIKQMLATRGDRLAELPIPLLEGEDRGGQGCVGVTTTTKP